MRLIHPQCVARLCTLMLGMGLVLPPAAAAAPQAKASPSKTAARKTDFARLQLYERSLVIESARRKVVAPVDFFLKSQETDYGSA